MWVKEAMYFFGLIRFGICVDSVENYYMYFFDDPFEYPHFLRKRKLSGLCKLTQFAKDAVENHLEICVDTQISTQKILIAFLP